MINREKLYLFANQYQQNQIRYAELNDSLYDARNYEEWLERLKQRSDATRDVFSLSAHQLDFFREQLKSIEPEEALVYYDVLLDVFFDRFRSSDYPLAIEIAQTILPFFEEKSDYDRMIRLYAAIYYWNMEYYDRQMEYFLDDTTINYAKKVLKLKDRYRFVSDPQSRLRIFRTYANMIGSIADLYHLDVFEVSTYYNEVMELWNSDMVQEMDGENDEFTDEIEWIKDSFLEYCISDVIGNIYSDPDNGKMKVCLDHIRTALASAEQLGGGDGENELFSRGRFVLGVIRGENTVDEMLEMIWEDYYEIPSMDFTEFSDDENMDWLDAKCINVFNFFKLLKFSTLTPAQREERAERIMADFMDECQKIPGNAYTDYVNDIYLDIFEGIKPYILKGERKREILRMLVIDRQPMTFVHSYMVGRLARCIGEEIIASCPEAFTGMPGYDGVADVTDKREELLDYLQVCGELHDAGKCKITGVVNRQTRKINDKEFSSIKLHPLIGARMLGDDEYFSSIVPAVEGHHKTYDGKGGYPNEFDNVSSAYKPSIDLISICDALDSATDRFGRNYNTVKTFDDVLGELIAGAGTRYHPLMVEAIDKSGPLKETLRFLLTEGRQEAYYNAYKNFRNKEN